MKVLFANDDGGQEVFETPFNFRSRYLLRKGNLWALITPEGCAPVYKRVAIPDISDLQAVEYHPPPVADTGADA